MIIATSNAGTLDIQAGIKAGQSLESIKGSLIESILLKQFPPELLNRFDGVILFSPLEPNQVEQITRLQLDHLVNQVKDTKGIFISYTDAVVGEVAVKAFDPLLGARPIRRYLQDHVESVIATAILSQQASKGAKLILDFDGQQFVLKS
jgi:ATP-dependent Clp protease ATP-binding subunit ClpB